VIATTTSVAVVVTGAGRPSCAGGDITAGEETFAKQDEGSFSAGRGGGGGVGRAQNGHRGRSTVTRSVSGSPWRCSATSGLIAREAKCGFVHVRRGVIPDAYSHWSVPRRQSASPARRSCF